MIIGSSRKRTPRLRGQAHRHIFRGDHATGPGSGQGDQHERSDQRVGTECGRGQIGPRDGEEGGGGEGGWDADVGESGYQRSSLRYCVG